MAVRPRESAAAMHVAVVSDDRLFADGLMHIIAADDSAVVVESAIDADVALVDGRTDRAFAYCAELVGEYGPSVVFVAAPDDDDWASAALDSGARGILVKSSSADDLMTAIRAVYAGLIWARRRVLAARIDYLTGATVQRRSAELVLERRLSAREREVFRYAAAGLGNKELAGRLAISEATVKVHLTHIFQKLGLRGRAELAAAFHGVISPAH